MKNLPVSERPREKALLKGVENLSNLELLEIIIGSGTKGNSVIDISYELLKLMDGLNNCHSISLEELKKINGISDVKAIEILTIIELSKRINNNYENSDTISISSPQMVYDMYKGKLNNNSQERMLILYLNNKNVVIKEEIMFIGGSDFINIDPNLILYGAIKYNSKNIICLHNHPSGDPTPSKNDIITTKRIKEMSVLLNINLLDHIIVGKNFYSFKENDLL